jgi:hypothetical protein
VKQILNVLLIYLNQLNVLYMFVIVFEIIYDHQFVLIKFELNQNDVEQVFDYLNIVQFPLTIQ